MLLYVRYFQTIVSLQRLWTLKELQFFCSSYRPWILHLMFLSGKLRIFLAPPFSQIYYCPCTNRRKKKKLKIEIWFVLNVIFCRMALTITASQNRVSFHSKQRRSVVQPKLLCDCDARSIFVSLTHTHTHTHTLPRSKFYSWKQAWLNF